MRILVGIFLGVLLWSCDNSPGVKIKVETDAEVPANGLVVLLELQEGGLKPIDTLELDDDGIYKATLVTESESFYRVDLFRTQFVNLVLDGSEKKVSVIIKGADKKVEGSKKSEWVNSIDALIEKSKADIGQLNQEAGMANQQGDAGTLQAIIDEYNAMMIRQIATIKSIVRESNPSLAAIYGLNYLDPESEFQFYDSIISKTHDVMPEHFWVKEFKDNLEVARKLAIGQPAPDFTLNTPEGNPMSLSDFRGKYVLIDFWAAWCRPCRVENPNVVRAYQKYGGDQFEILGVSLDRTREAWIKAIEEDGLTWKHVSDIQYFNSAAAQLYNITAIPATYLIDPQGNILAKNLRGASLDAKLVELFGE
jgi:peroxiredoxin